MSEITIGMKRDRIRRFGEELIAAAEARATIDVTLYGESNADGGGDEVIINIGNDDMERDDLHDDAVLVDIDR